MYFQTLIKSLDCSHDDREALFTLCLFHSLIKNQGMVIIVRFYPSKCVFLADVVCVWLSWNIFLLDDESSSQFSLFEYKQQQHLIS